MDFVKFDEWYRELGKLKIFWAKPINDLRLASTGDMKWLVEIEWIERKRIKKATMSMAPSYDEAIGMMGKSKYEDTTKLIIVPEDYMLSSSCNINAKSILYFWDIDSKTIEANRKVKITTLFNWEESDLDVFRQIHKMSWGFFIPPREGDHIVVLAYLKDLPVGMAYLNKNNFNIDYGVHVVRNLWRNRIGTRILVEVLNLAKRLGARYISVVRILRSLTGSSSDRRAILFYKANNPSLRFNVWRIR